MATEAKKCTFSLFLPKKGLWRHRGPFSRGLRPPRPILPLQRRRRRRRPLQLHLHPRVRVQGEGVRGQEVPQGRGGHHQGAQEGAQGVFLL